MRAIASGALLVFALLSTACSLVRPGNPCDATAVTAGQDHSIVLQSDGTVWATGDNHWG